FFATIKKAKRMRLIEIIKQNIIAAVAVAMVVGFSAFKISAPQPAEFVWYERVGTNQYQLMDNGTPSPEPSNGCGTTITTLCAKGFPQDAAPAEEDITDATIASNRYHLP